MCSMAEVTGAVAGVELDLLAEHRCGAELDDGRDHRTRSRSGTWFAFRKCREWGGGQPLTEPAVMPETIWRWKNMKRISGGIVTSRMSMNSRLNELLYWLWKL